MDVTKLNQCRVLVRKIKRSGGRNCYYSNRSTEVTEAGKVVNKYDGEIVIQDPVEMAAAKAIQSMVNAYHKLGVHTDFGIIVPTVKLDQAETLDGQIREAVTAFNGAARYSRLRFVAGALETTGDGASVLEAMLDDITDKLGEVESALATLEPTTIRKALANFQKNYLEMLPEDAAAVVSAAVDGARKSAKDMKLGQSRLSRAERKLAEITGGQDAVEALERLQGADQTREMRDRARAIMKLMDDKQDAIDQIEDVKRQISEVPVSLARFAVMRQVEQVPEAPAEAPAEVLARFAAMAPVPEGNPDDAAAE